MVMHTEPSRGELPTDAVALSTAGRAVGAGRGAVMAWARRGLIRYWMRAGTRYFVSLAEVKALVVPSGSPPPRVPGTPRPPTPRAAARRPQKEIR